MSTSYDICASSMTVDDLDARMRVFHDIKKAHRYNKHTGKWAWCDRDEQDIPESWHEDFDTFWEMILDATEPYFEEEGE